eukprot:g6312.t1
MARFFAVSGPPEITGYNWVTVKTKPSPLASAVPYNERTKGGKGKAAVRTLCDGLKLTAEGEAALAGGRRGVQAYAWEQACTGQGSTRGAACARHSPSA